MATRKLWLVFGGLFLFGLGAACGSSDNGDAPGADAGASSEPDAGSDAAASPPPPNDASFPSDGTLPTPPADAAAGVDAGAPTDASAAPDANDAGDASDAGLDLSGQDITFFAFGDPQFGGGPADKNSFHIQALNAAAALTWPADGGFESSGPIGDPRGVIIAGDLTQNGQSGRDPFNEWYLLPQYQFDLNAEYGIDASVPVVAAELGLFLRDYGLRGNDGKDPFVLKYRVFEGYGNHDFDTLTPDPSADPVYYGNEAPARDVVSLRNRVRASWPEMRRFAPGNAGHYSWDWDQTHFVHLNLVGSDKVGGDDDGGSQAPRDPQGALTFLIADLAAEVGTSCRPVILIMHYGFDDFSEEGRWWDEEQRQAFLQAIRPYDIAAILHGHVHETRAYSMADTQGKAYDVFSLGSPYYEGQATNGGRGHFQVFHIKGKHIDAADISWLPSNPAPAMGDNVDLWTGKTLADVGFQITTTFADGWGGWAYSKDIDVSSCAKGYMASTDGP
ncbi:MAG TPA: hypothetical protein VGI39_25295 [Polyangiaceae bacterium]|jgi:cytolysin (calcineurin-like family phosphatase)